MSWSPAQYVRFEADRTRPVRDLLAAIPPIEARTVIDLGCGPGNSTELLCARYPGAVATGLDTSPAMLAAARARLPQVTFAEGDITTWNASRPVDVILVNAVLQWVPDHATLLPHLLTQLAPGGSLAVQMPENMAEPSQRAMDETAANGPWSGLLATAGGFRSAMLSVDATIRLLRPLCSHVDVWRTTYMHILPGGPDAIVEWFKGSGLRPFLAPLEPREQTGFLDRYRRRIADAYPALPDGSAVLPFPRLFIVATV